MEAIWAGIFGLLLSYVLVFTLDRFIATSSITRLLILVGGVSVFAIFAPLWINRWVFKHRRENQIAQLIAKQHPSLGDRLLGVVELENQVETNTSLSPRLREAAMQQVAKELSSRDLNDALPITWHKKWGLAVLVLASIAATACFTSPKAGLNALQRWLMPLAQIERYTRTKIDKSQLLDSYFIAHGEPFSITVQLTEDSNTPPSATAQLGDEAMTESPETERKYTFNYAKASSQKTLQIRVGDAFESVEIKPIMRPTLQQTSATIEFPDYLQKENQSQELTSGQASILEGSTVTVTARSNRPLTAANASIRVIDTAPVDLPTSIQSNTITLDPLVIEHESLILTMGWTDQHQLASASPSTLRIQKLLDQPPAALIEKIADATYVMADASIQFDIAAEDDFAVKRAGFAWEGAFTKPSPNAAAKGSLTVINGNPQLQQARESIDFSFNAYEITPQKLTIRAWAEHYKPNSPRVYSAPITVYVLSKAEHRELMERRTRDTINQLEDAMRNELELLDQNKRLERLSGEDLQKQENRDKIAAQAQKERDNTEAMKDIAKNMEDVFKEASKNDKIDTDTLKKLAEAALKMQQLAEQKMPEISKKLENSQSKENTEEKAKEEIKEAVAKQAELIKEMQDAIEQSSDASKQLEAGTFVNRLQKAAADEELIAKTIIDLMQPQSTSNILTHFSISEFEELDPADQRAALTLYGQQKQTGSDINWIEEDLAHFFLRTQKKEHQELLNKMRDSTITEDMNILLQKMELSKNYLSIELAKQSATTLREWAKDFSKSTQKENSSGGGGGGGGGADDEDFEFMIRVMRIIQQEDQVRSQIRSLEQKNRLHNTKPNIQQPAA